MVDRPLLEAIDVVSGYGRHVVLKGIQFEVRPGEVVAIIGSNGAGKTTLLRTLSGAIRLMRGSIRLLGLDVAGMRPSRLVRGGIVHVPEGRNLFPTLTVDDHLLLGAFCHDKTGRSKSTASTRDDVLRIFPRLVERLQFPAGVLSGGEQQMLAIARALMARPKLLLVDEPSLGLAPQVVTAIVETLRRQASLGIGVVIVEQNARLALAKSDRAYVMEKGRVVLGGESKALSSDARVVAAYLGERPPQVRGRRAGEDDDQLTHEQEDVVHRLGLGGGRVSRVRQLRPGAGHEEGQGPADPTLTPDP